MEYLLGILANHRILVFLEVLEGQEVRVLLLCLEDPMFQEPHQVQYLQEDQGHLVVLALLEGKQDKEVFLELKLDVYTNKV